MSTPLTMTDIEFVRLPELTQRHHLYLYRENSALLRAAVRAKVIRHAELEGRELRDILTCPQRVVRSRPLPPGSQAREGSSRPRGDGWPGFDNGDASAELSETRVLPSLHLTVAEPSLLGETLAVHDLGDKTLAHPPIDDIERALDLISRDAGLQSLCLLVPDTHEVVQTDAWRAAVETVGLIEEPKVTPEDYLLVARTYFPQSRLGDLSHLSENRRFLSRLRKFVEQRTCTPFELSLQIDLIVLGEMEGGEFRSIEQTETKRRRQWVLPETLRRFLDDRDGASFSALMQLVDGLHHDRMLEPDEILTRLYRATTTTLESRDKRYRRLEDPLHCVWAALLLANEGSFLNGNTFVAMDCLCQSYSRASEATPWFSSRDGWQAIAPLIEIAPAKDPSRLDRARLELQRALRARLEAMQEGGLDWFNCLISLSESGDTTRSSNEQRVIAIREVD
ncbi:hypothetical protein [Bradyrhizobium sp. USDA 313]|uniref:hypothetical protein n=1 Tax=Bradyrhizobium sp. USDA 313 TaxID=3156307 RepID=UPI0035185CD5